MCVIHIYTWIAEMYNDFHSDDSADQEEQTGGKPKSRKGMCRFYMLVHKVKQKTKIKENK